MQLEDVGGAGRQACFGVNIAQTQFSLLHSISGHCSACRSSAPLVTLLRLGDEAMHHRCFGGWGRWLNLGHGHVVNSGLQREGGLALTI